MTVYEALKYAEQQLNDAGISTARLDALILLEDCTSIDRSQLLAEPDRSLSVPQQTKLTKLLRRRVLHEPLAYIRGYTEFYGRNFVITPAVLEPRPESETMIDLLKCLVSPRQPEPVSGPSSPKTSQILHIADIGTGSGALGITAKIELPNTSVDLLEIDPEALQVAKMNVDKFTLKIRVLQSDLIANSDTNYDILLCNLPYVPDDYDINHAATHEPRLAIFGGPDGLVLYRNLFAQVAKLQKQPLYILTESLPTQHTALSNIARKHNYKLQKTDDFIQLFMRIH